MITANQDSHSVYVTRQDISTEWGSPTIGWLAECSCHRFTAQAENYDVVVEIVYEHMVEALLVGA